MGSLLCSNDVITALSLLSPETQPKIYSLIFGEGVVNDAVTVILFTVITQHFVTDKKSSAS